MLRQSVRDVLTTTIGMEVPPGGQVAYFENEYGKVVVAVTGVNGVTVYHEALAFEPKRFDRRFFNYDDIYEILRAVLDETISEGALSTLGPAKAFVESLREAVGNLDGVVLTGLEQKWLRAVWEAAFQIETLVPLSVAEASREYGVSQATLYAAIKGGALIGRKTNGTILVKRGDVERFLRGLHKRRRKKKGE